MRCVIVGSLLVVTLLSGCSSAQDFDNRLNPVVAPYRFSITGWEVGALTGQVKQWFSDLHIGEWVSGKPVKQAGTVDEVKVVEDYFDSAKQINLLQAEITSAQAKNQIITAQLQDALDNLQKTRAAQTSQVEEIIQGQVRATLAEQGIFNPTGKGTSTFPPLVLKIEELPSVLVISPRDKIVEIQGIVLKQNLSLGQKESIEAGADKLGVSSLVVSLGGLATYPSLIDNGSSLQATLEISAHEWLHQYLAFTPLGFRYLLDVSELSKNYDIATMNESLASMFGKEVGDMVYKKYYAGQDAGIRHPASAGFDFNAEMRNIRKTVDTYLAQGEIDRAEDYMQQKQQELAAHGYFIRKLNQAYFAFYGTYADSPAFLNPIGADMANLRSKSASLKAFLNTAAGMTSRQDLTASVR